MDTDRIGSEIKRGVYLKSNRRLPASEMSVKPQERGAWWGVEWPCISTTGARTILAAAADRDGGEAIMDQ